MKIKEKNRVIILRKKGHSINELSKIFKVSKSSISLWVRNIHLNKKALIRLKKRSLNGRKKSIKVKREKREKIVDKIVIKVQHEIKKIDNSKNLNKLFCSLLYWCEGGKENTSVRFINSDPNMIVAFLYLFRSSFKINEKKFRACLHLHKYHDEFKQKIYWSKITKIPVCQFLKTYKQSNTGKRQKKNYPGCVSIRYYDYRVAIELNILWKIFGEKYGRVG